MPSAFVTGASGCVGHYVVEELSPDYELYLLVRDPSRLMFDPDKKGNITIVRGDMDSIPELGGILSRVDHCIHIATAWGGDWTERINVQRVHEMFSQLNPDKVKRIIYFSTASILGKDNKVLPEAQIYGTDYVRTKYLCYTKLPECELYNRIITVFPTIVFGGSNGHPFAQVSLALPKLKKYAWLLGRFNIDVSFHFIHAEDIAKIVRYILETPEPRKNYVLGNEPVTFGEFTRRTAAYFGRKPGWQLNVSPDAIYRLAKTLGAKMSEWDRFCLEYKDFRYDSVNCPSLGLSSSRSTIEEIVSDWKLVQEHIQPEKKII